MIPAGIGAIILLLVVIGILACINHMQRQVRRNIAGDLMSMYGTTKQLQALVPQYGTAWTLCEQLLNDIDNAIEDLDHENTD